MTREEAIKIFHTVLFFGKCDCSKEEIEECLKMAIKALRQESTTKNDLGVTSELEKNSQKLEKDFGELDCISRASARSLICDIDLKHHTFGMSRKVFKDLYNGMDELPSITPQEPQTFEWCETCKEYDQEKHCCHRWTKVIRNTVEEMKQEYIEREVLDKIRAEIKALSNANPSYWHSGDMVDRDDVLEILDKYKAENNS